MIRLAEGLEAARARLAGPEPRRRKLRIRFEAAALLAALLAGCAPGAGTVSAPLAFTMPRTAGAVHDQAGQDALADAVESVDDLLASGQEAFQADPNKRSATEYCRAGEEDIAKGELREAIRQKSKALFVSRQAGDAMLSAECARSIAIAYSFAGLDRRALDWADETDRYLQQAGRDANAARVAAVRGPLSKVRADAAVQRGDFVGARAFLAAGRAAAPDYYLPYILVSLAQIDLAQHDLAGAEADLNAATDHQGVPDALYAIIVRTMGEVSLARNNLDDAAKLFAYGSELSDRAGDDYGRAWSERGRAQIDLIRGQRAAAAADYARAITAADQSRAVFRTEELRSGAFGTLQAIYDEAIDNLATMGRWEEAFDVSERSRARSLRDIVRDRAGAGSGEGRTATAREVQASLPPGTALMSYHMLPDRLLVWTVRNSSIQGTPVGVTGDALTAMVRSFILLASHPGQAGRIDTAAQSLYGTLVRPAGIQPHEQIVFVPHGILHNLPFAALKDGGRWLVEDHVISETPAAGSYVGIAPGRLGDGHGVVIFSNPDGTLPFADKEAAAVAKSFPGAAAWSGAQASKARFIAQASGARVIHVAAHGVYDALDPLASKVRLARGTQLSGDLEARDVYGMTLPETQLLVLSACETSKGSPTPGDEVIGFNRSFLAAGVRNLVSTLWSVDDESTAALMTLFYQNLAAGPQPPSIPQALQKAQVELLHNSDFAAPVFWAAFTVNQAAGRG